jgi:hypothetical protein
MIDLNLRIRSNSNIETKKNLLKLFDKIFYKEEDYVETLEYLKNIKFQHSLYELEIITTLYLLFLIEQEFNYPDEKSKFNPKTLFLH